MLNRILTGWTFTRALYAVLGLYMIVNSALSQQWLGMAVGAYFASMGFFAFGCAAGACYTPTRKAKIENETKEVEFEEIK